MSTETFFTLAEYKQNYQRLKKEFINAYVDNDDDEFIKLQMEWYAQCIENTIIEHGILVDSIGWETKAIIRQEGFVGVVDKKIRNEWRGINKEAAQNLNVSFSKIVKYLEKEKRKTIKVEGSPTQAQWALYHFVLQECKLKPRFQHKVREISDLAEEYGVGNKNLQLKYNQISNSGGQEGYSEVDVIAVKILLEINYPKAIPKLNILTQHVF